MKTIISKCVELLRNAPGWLRAALIALILLCLGGFSWLYVSCGSLSLKELDWKHNEAPSGPVDIVPVQPLPPVNPDPSGS